VPNRWNKGDVLKLIADCELGKYGDVLRVTSVDGPYMTATVERRDAPDPTVHTGRDYTYAVKVGEFQPDEEPLFSWVGDALTECGLKLRAVEERMREVPTARHCADRVAELCARIDEVAEEFANEDHMGNK